MELPLDHFRLIGVSPSATSEEILRAFQLRLDKTPDEGFTYEVLTQRSELLRLTADLLTDPESRREYENLLLNGTSGLEFSSNREVAALILLWESGSSKEAFKITRKALQPPQTPALGSSREADLTLLAALTARDSAFQEQELRSYSNAADFLQEGIQLLQRMGKLGERRKELEEDLVALLPYRILDLLSRDLNDQESHKKGLSMLENLIIKRGGLEGSNKSEYGDYLNQQDFEAFFQQIKTYLTVQEQIDLFLELQKRGSLEAGFLAFLSLTAIGFSRRKPEKLFEARRILKKLNLSGLDSMPLIGCLDLLLADIDQASARFSSSSDENLRDWLGNYQGNKLEAICIFCKNWLENDVLVGYRDIDSKEVDLDAWFEDREIQEFIEKLEKKSNKTIIKSNFQNQQFKKDYSTKITEDLNSPIDNIDERRLPWPGGIKQEYEKLDIQERKFNEEIFKNKSIEFYQYFIEKFAELKFGFGEFLKGKEIIRSSPYLIYIYAFLILFTFGIGIGFLRNNFKKSIQEKVVSEKPLIAIDENQKVSEKDIIQEIKKDTLIKLKSLPEKSNAINSSTFKEITTASPSLEDIRNLINEWLRIKSNYLAGKSELNLSKFVSNGLIDRTIEERQKDIKKGIYKEIYSQIRKMDLESQTSSRIVALVELNYLERIVKSSGEFVNETTLTPLKVKYIFGFSNKSWKLVDFVSGL
ncbi:MAG: IMS domain-containing protein [Prochlorococcus marinus CUG1439]|uniref:IMS domain-containing protein n=1 Tax=Prochlorococcus sp. MIT 1314 TaxID=3096220 RepID=UPI001B05B168|nr:IMS domain-containing protein [Prochlorococcus sp. MIT 1314]MCR8538850.1 IMS domain-containing protein [Prochlorococcus marinus CUG1439]